MSQYYGRLLEREEGFLKDYHIPNTKIAKFGKVSKEVYEKSIERLRGKGVTYTNTVRWEDIKYPERSTKGSAGYDFFSTVDVLVPSGTSVIIPTGLRVDMYEGWVLVIYARSSMAKKGISLLNTSHVIDSDYCLSEDGGHMSIPITYNGGGILTISRGDRIAQGVFQIHGLTMDDNQDQPDRVGGWGSTGK